MDLILYKNEVILMAPTGAATDNISGNTYYTLLGIGLFKIQKLTVSAYIRKLWFKKTIIIINKISIIDLTSLSTINN